MSDEETTQIQHLDDRTFDLVRYIAGKAIEESELVDVKGEDPRGIRVALALTASDVSWGCYYTPPGVEE
jgi:hypothetical protein